MYSLALLVAKSSSAVELCHHPAAAGRGRHIFLTYLPRARVQYTGYFGRQDNIFETFIAMFTAQSGRAHTHSTANAMNGSRIRFSDHGCWVWLFGISTRPPSSFSFVKTSTRDTPSIEFNTLHLFLRPRCSPWRTLRFSS